MEVDRTEARLIGCLASGAKLRDANCDCEHDARATADILGIVIVSPAFLLGIVVYVSVVAKFGQRTGEPANRRTWACRIVERITERGPQSPRQRPRRLAQGG